MVKQLWVVQSFEVHRAVDVWYRIRLDWILVLGRGVLSTEYYASKLNVFTYICWIAMKYVEAFMFPLRSW